MCISAAAMMAVSTAMTVAGKLQEGAAQQEASNEQARQLAMQAGREQAAAEEEAKRIQKAGDRTAGAARAALAASGVMVDQGTSININEDIYKRASDDAYQTLLTGQRKASNLTANADQAIKSGQNAMTSSLLSAGASAFSGWKGVKEGQLLDQTLRKMNAERAG